MEHLAGDHDQGTGVHDPDATAAPADGAEALRAALDGLRLDGAMFLRGEYTERWAYSSPPGPELARLLRPGRTRLVLLHVVVTGRCWIAVDDGERHWARRGDVIVIPYGDRHAMGGSADAEIVPVTDLLTPPPWPEMPVIRHGAGGARTDLVCGYLDTDDPLFDPDLRALPPVFVVRPTGTAAAWMETSVAYAIERLADGPDGTSLLATTLPQLVLTEALRLHLTSAPAADHGWLAALVDPVLAPALGAIHRDPGRRWTVADLAAAGAVSRSGLDARFRGYLGRSPIRYLTEWRMHVARDLLRSTDLGVQTVARRVGYDAEAAFSRAFKRESGAAPAHWRAARCTHASNPAR